MRLDPRLTFERLVVGAGNRLAAAAARAVAESPGTTYNPLFVYGGSGLGKTHILTATAHRLLTLQPEAEVLALTLDEFSEQWHAAVSAGETQALGGRLGRADLLLIDDIQFLTGRREMQAELLRLFSAMQDDGRQIVCTSDRPPSEIGDVDERLIRRLAGGLVVDVDFPEYEARVAILRSAFFFKIATRASKFGSCTSVMRPIANRERRRSSRPGISEGTVSEVITTALLIWWSALNV